MTEWAKLKVVNLKAELKRRGLPQAGLKTELVARLEESDAAEQAEQPDVADEAEQLEQTNEAEQPDEAGETEQKEQTDEVDQPDTSSQNSDSAAQDDTSRTVDVEDNNATHYKEPSPRETADAELEAAVLEEEPAVSSSIVDENSLQPKAGSPLLEPEQEQEDEQEAQQKQLKQQSKPESELESVPEPEEGMQQEQVSSETISKSIADEAPTQGSASVATTTMTSRLETAQDQDINMEDAEARSDGDSSSRPSHAGIALEFASESMEQPQLEAQKRKRRSASPVPLEQDIARKRARATSPSVVQQHEQDASLLDIDYDRHVEPSIHPATSALYINNLMRPLRPADLRAHVVALAAIPGSVPDDATVTKFHLDFIRTHALMELSSVSAASRVRQLLHGRVWPNESNRKALHIDFIPPDKIDPWIAMEDTGDRRPATRWEVAYTPSADGSTIHADLVSTSLSSSSSTRPALPPPSFKPVSSAITAVPPGSGVNSAPLGPRGYSDNSNIAPPTGPRGSGHHRRPLPPAANNANAPLFPPGQEQYTHTKPTVSYTFVSKDIVEKRVANMRSYYTRDKRSLGREINRYSFEDGASFVDRGREIFEGIRPPHRERGGRVGGGGGGGGGGRGDARGRRGGRGGGGGFRPRSDRYIPGGGRDDFRSRRY
ncbi:hypothetical protein E4U21_007584 [Claviceps maximensis]|nr:hypothetical protein E4U21_007584 [Claviceps maximensis]